MEPVKGFLSGKKTYLLAGVALVASFASFAVGEGVAGFEVETFGDFLRDAVEPLLAMTLRAGIAKK